MTNPGGPPCTQLILNLQSANNVEFFTIAVQIDPKIMKIRTRDRIIINFTGLGELGADRRAIEGGLRRGAGQDAVAQKAPRHTRVQGRGKRPSL